MANKTPQEQPNALDKVNDSLLGIEEKVAKNQKTIMWFCVACAAVFVLVLCYIFLIRQPAINGGNDAIGVADMELISGNDSLALKQYQTVADQYGHDAGNRANLNAAIILYSQGKYQEALDYVKKYSADENIIGATSKSLEGDCLVNLDKLDEALACYKAAESKSDENPALTPYFILKQATVYDAQKNYAAAAEAYQTIIDKYPFFGPQLNIDIEKYLERAKAQAGNK